MDIIYINFPKLFNNVKFVKNKNRVYINLSYCFDHLKIEYSPLIPLH